MPTPYRRACGHCIKSKRRCDLAVPRCHRCQVRSLDCQYQHANTSHASREGYVNPSSLSVGNVSSQPAHGSLNLRVETLHMAVDLSTDFPVPLPEPTLEWWNTTPSIELPAPNEQQVELESHSTYYERKLLGRKYQQRIYYATQRLKLFPSTFATSGRTIFIHPSLYDAHLPEVLGDTMALCALYATKSDANQEMVYRIIGQRAHRLVDEFDWLATPLEYLASIQALGLIQIIRLFDGDIRQRADGERAQPTFMNGIRGLQHKMQGIEDGWRTELISQPEDADAWGSWLYAESVRRTVIFGHILDTLYYFLRDGWHNSHEEFFLLSFFGQRSLWAASSKFHWGTTLEETNACPLRFYSWDRSIAAVRPEDLDELGILMTALMKGVDHCRDWIGPDMLEQFGLQP
ncbi:hypothetical protein N7470_004221 [Penicillium chermesinum]|nr:hypothetical protein N7470_004221 [Penicillium chermesinum]